jgi:Family of unknown function (DUF5684)
MEGFHVKWHILLLNLYKMENQTFLIALKWAAIQFAFGLAAMGLPKLFGGVEPNQGLMVLMGFTSFVVQIAIVVMALRDLERRAGGDMTPGKAFSLYGIMFMLQSAGNLLSSYISFKFLMKEEMSPFMDNKQMLIYSIGFSVLVSFLIYIVSITIYGIWRVFTKAGQPGWASVVPIYNAVVQCEIGQKPGWWVLMLFIPFANIVFAVMIANGISKAFGKDEGFTAGLIFLPFIFYPLLGFGPEKWIYGTQEPEVDNTRIEDHLVD